MSSSGMKGEPKKVSLMHRHRSRCLSGLPSGAHISFSSVKPVLHLIDKEIVVRSSSESSETNSGLFKSVVEDGYYSDAPEARDFDKEHTSDLSCAPSSVRSSLSLIHRLVSNSPHDCKQIRAPVYAVIRVIIDESLSAEAKVDGICVLTRIQCMKTYRSPR